MNFKRRLRNLERTFTLTKKWSNPVLCQNPAMAMTDFCDRCPQFPNGKPKIEPGIVRCIIVNHVGEPAVEENI